MPAATYIKLHVVKQLGCGACAEADPHLRELRRRHPLDVFIVEHYLDVRPDLTLGGWKPTATPAYVLLDGEKLVKKKVGLLTADQLEVWLGG